MTRQRRPQDRLRLLARIARSYYLDGRSKIAIGNDLRLSRFAVARHLEEARGDGIVTITLQSGARPAEDEHTTARHLGLQGCRIVEVYGEPESVRREVGRAAGAQLQLEILIDGDVLGIVWGRTLNAMVDDLDRLPQVEVVQLSGRLRADVQDSASALVLRSMALAGVGGRLLGAPFFDEIPAVVERYRSDERVARAVAGFDRLTVGAVSLGAVSPRPVGLAFDGMPRRFVEHAVKAGAVGEVGGILFAEDGRVIRDDLWRHLVTVTPAQLRAARRVVLVAAGAVKAEALRAACCSGLVTDAVIDASLAEAVRALPPAQ